MGIFAQVVVQCGFLHEYSETRYGPILNSLVVDSMHIFLVESDTPFVDRFQQLVPTANMKLQNTIHALNHMKGCNPSEKLPS